jgi:non-homologous end joining protein Ku
MLSDEDLADLPLSAARAIEVMAFVAEDAVDVLLTDRPYWLGGQVLARGKRFDGTRRQCGSPTPSTRSAET